MSRLIDADALIATIMKNRCLDCDRRKGVKHGKITFLYDFGEAPCRACDVSDMIDTLDNAPTICGWISVKDALPKTDAEVLTTYIYADRPNIGYVESASYFDDGDGKGHWNSIWDEYSIRRVRKTTIAWMPMPKPYKPPEEE